MHTGSVKHGDIIVSQGDFRGMSVSTLRSRQKKDPKNLRSRLEPGSSVLALRLCR